VIIWIVIDIAVSIQTFPDVNCFELPEENFCNYRSEGNGMRRCLLEVFLSKEPNKFGFHNKLVIVQI